MDASSDLATSVAECLESIGRTICTDLHSMNRRGVRKFGGGMAGVWKLWTNPKTSQWERTFAVITDEPNELVQPIHDRMTTFVEPRDYTEFLNTPHQSLI